MQPGEIIVVELSAGLRLARYVETKSNRVRVAIGRNREARLPMARVVHETGLTASSFEAVEELTRDAETIADELDLGELWDVVCEDGQALDLGDIGELYWGAEPSAVQTVAMLLHLSRDDLRFVGDGSHYVPVDRDTVELTIERRQRRAQQTQDADSLAQALREGALPDSLTESQTGLLDDVRGFVLHGEDYNRATPAKRFIEAAGVRGRDLQRGAFMLLVTVGQMDPDEHLAIEREGVPVEFSCEALAAAKALDYSGVDGDTDRLDLTRLTALTIDDAETRDRDDALSIEHLGGCAYRVGIHIADVGALFPPGSALDVEAETRLSSSYLPEGTVNMLPPAISADKASLVAGRARVAMTVFVDLSGDGKVADWGVVRSVIKSSRALSYEDADDAIRSPDNPLHSDLKALNDISTSLRSRREKNGALSLDRDELLVKVDTEGAISVRVIPRKAPARSLVQEYMVLCNSLLARYCAEHELPAPFRSQSGADVSDIGAQVPEGPLRWYMMARRLTPATIQTTTAKHGGLGVEAYTQATSPIRRYADLVVQRQISHHLLTGEALYDETTMISIAHRADLQVRLLGRIENQRRQHFFLKWLDGRRRDREDRGETADHDAVVLENQGSRTALLELAEWPVRTRAALPNSVQPGETVTLQLHGVDLWRRTAQFTLRA